MNLASLMFTDAQTARARRTSRATAVQGGSRRAGPATSDVSGEFPEASGAFVTFKRGGRLRGCIGTLRVPAAAARGSRARRSQRRARGPAVLAVDAPSELDDLDVEVSVLGPLEEIDPFDPAAFEIGRHGLVVEQGRRRGLLLPQVATEWNWDRETFLSQT